MLSRPSQPLGAVGQGRILRRDSVDLRAITGRQNHHLVDARLHARIDQRLSDLFGCKGHAFAQLHSS